jgi:glycerol-3-phosphate dehydrogenase
MNRDEMISRLAAPSGVAPAWDILIIGGGATGLGCAVDAAARGYRTALLEKADFGQGTSSRSTKLIHGGVRYLQQGNIKLVRESLHERGLLLRNAPHLVHRLPFIVPAYKWWEPAFYGAGLKMYDVLAGNQRIARSQFLSRSEVLQRAPTIRVGWLARRHALSRRAIRRCAPGDRARADRGEPRRGGAELRRGLSAA